MRNHKIIALALSATFLSGLLIGCNQSNNSANSASSGQITGTTYKVTFNAGDGKFADGTSSKVVETASGATVTLPDNPTKEGYAFDAWYKDDSYKVLFNVATAITADWTLYAGYKVADVSSSADTSSGEKSTTSDGVDHSGGGTLVSWYMCGSGSLWAKDDWSIADGVQMYSNPNSTTDKAMYLAVTFAVDDVFKVTDGTKWSGYDNIDTSASETNKGLTNFTGVDDGYGGKNIKCTIAGTYDIYVNASLKYWIQAHA